MPGPDAVAAAGRFLVVAAAKIHPEDTAFIGVYPMSVRPLVSIITPTYNHERFIAACLEAALAQTFRDWEMMVIDDASGDGTAEIVQKYAKIDGRIRLIRHKTNWGMEKLSATYNQGLAAAGGEWIAILEGDDAWPSWKLSRQLRELAGDPEIILGFGKALLISPAGKPLGDAQTSLPAYCQPYFRNFRGRAILPLLLRPCFIHPVTVMIRRPALEKIGGFLQPPDLSLVDHPTFLELARQGIFYGSANVLGHYRRHRDSQSLNHIVAMTRGERRLVFDFIGTMSPPVSNGLRRRIARSWELETAWVCLTEGRLRLLRGQRHAARDSFCRSLLAEKPVLWLHVPLLAVKLAAVAAMVFSFLPVNLERIIGWLKLRSSSLLEQSEKFEP